MNCGKEWLSPARCAAAQGILLLGVGEHLDQVNISALRRYYHIDPPKKGILVRVPSNK